MAEVKITRSVINSEGKVVGRTIRRLEARGGKKEKKITKGLFGKEEKKKKKLKSNFLSKPLKLERVLHRSNKATIMVPTKEIMKDERQQFFTGDISNEKNLYLR